jgi:hypothetical protein
MRSRLRALAPAVGFLLIAALVFTASPARAAMDRPAWASGDFWVYSYSSGLTGATINGTLRMDVTGTESVNVNGSSYPTYHVTAVLTIPFGSFTFSLPADIWYNSNTLAIVKIVATVNLTFGTISENSRISISGDPPQIIQWPLTAGASWDSSTTVWQVTTNSTGAVRYTQVPLTTHFEVQTDASITVPAGTFTTTPLKETAAGSTSFVVNYWSPQAGNSVRTESHNGSGQSAGGYNLTSYRYQAGSFFTTVFVGLPVWIWLILAVLILAAVIGISFVRRRRPPVGAPPPGYAPPPQPPETPP